MQHTRGEGHSSTDERIVGVVKYYDDNKGYGFVRPTHNAGRDVFMHANAVRAAGLQLAPGDRVEFRVEMSACGPRAVDLALAPAGAVEEVARG